MVKLERFDIVFENAEQAYFAGQEVAGKIVIESGEAKKVNEILLEIKGRAKTYWTKHSGKSRRHCSSSDLYFCEQFNTKYTHKFDTAPTTATVADASTTAAPTATTVADGTAEIKENGALNGRQIGAKRERILPAGVHEIPFSYTLPKSLPSSFEGEFGYVRYTARAICERPWDFDICARRAFTVVGVEDLNEEADALRPVSNTATVHHRQLWCVNHGEVTAELQLARGAFTPGEAIVANARIQNKSRRTLRAVSLALCQNVTYKAKTFSGVEQTRQTTRVVARLERGGEIRANSEALWSDATITVPSVTPRLPKCKIIQVTYTLQLEIPSSGAKVSVPLIIGTIPLLSQIVKRAANASGAAENSSAAQQNASENDASTSVAPDDSAIVQVTITDESGRTAAVTDDATAAPPQASATSALDDGVDAPAISLRDKREDADALNGAKKRVRMPSSILSELYPTLPSPYYKESCFGRVSISDEKERNQFGENFFAPKYPFYADD